MGLFPARVLVVVPTFLVVVLDRGRETTPLLVDELPFVALCFCAGTRGFIGLTSDVVVLETACFLGEIAFAVALDLTGRAVIEGFVTVVRRVAVVLVVTVAARTVVADRVGLVAGVSAVRFVEATVGRTLVAGL